MCVCIYKFVSYRWKHVVVAKVQRLFYHLEVIPRVSSSSYRNAQHTEIETKAMCAEGDADLVAILGVIKLVPIDILNSLQLILTLGTQISNALQTAMIEWLLVSKR